MRTERDWKIPTLEQGKHDLMSYMCHGEPDRQSGIRYIDQWKTRELLLMAGYTEAALFSKWSGRRSPIQSGESASLHMTFTLDEGNRYGWEAGEYSVWSIPLLVKEPTDHSDGNDPLRSRILGELHQFTILRAELTRSGRKWFYFGEKWVFDRTMEKLRFLLNPRHREVIDQGLYTLEELREWLDETDHIIK